MAEKWRERVRGHLALRQEGWPPSCTTCLSSITGKWREYDTPSLKTIKGVASAGPTKAAWFKDSEGNILALLQFVQALRLKGGPGQVFFKVLRRASLWAGRKGAPPQKDAFWS